MRTLKYRLSKGAVAPVKATSGAAGYDCFAFNREFLTVKNGELVTIRSNEAKTNDLIRYSSGVTLEIPKGYAVLTFARSSIAKMPLIMANTTGVVDSDYRGKVLFVFRILDPSDIDKKSYQIGDRIGQIVVTNLADLDLEEVTILSKTKRGSGAIGSTGR